MIVRALIFAASLAVSMLAAGATVPDGSAAADSGEIDPADYTTDIDNPLLPLSSFAILEFEGEEVDPDSGETTGTRDVMTVLPQTGTVGGVEVLVIRDDAYEDGELVESTLDYFAQHSDGSVHYFGERVDNYIDGEIANHDGSWLAGEDGALPGVYMPADPYVGLVFEQEQAPGVAEDRSTVVAIDIEKTVPAGTFSGCIETEDINPLDTPVHVEHKVYCPGAGLIREESDRSHLDLVAIGFAATPAPAATPSPSPTAASSPAPTPTPATFPSAGGDRDGADFPVGAPFVVAGVVAALLGAAVLVIAARRRTRE